MDDRGDEEETQNTLLILYLQTVTQYLVSREDEKYIVVATCKMYYVYGTREDQMLKKNKMSLHLISLREVL